ncbi:citron-like protein [Mycena albidolilacea]|uniref:Citron-like protein n=1 Tax=Mycena albidolilacea TaxID=1033008 RepID=A0AAD7F0R5_9AGAR|nr:citron-like protein [Mycena albidolilacea]
MAFDSVVLNEGFFGSNKVHCAARYRFGDAERIVYGTDDGVFVSDLNAIGKDPVMVLALCDVRQVDVLPEDYQLLVVLTERQVLNFPLDALDSTDPTVALKQSKRIASDTSLVKVGFCLERLLVCIIKTKYSSSTVKVLEPIRESSRLTADTFRVFKELFIPNEVTSVHWLKTRICVGCSRGFEVADMKSQEIYSVLNSEDESLEFVRPKSGFLPSFRKQKNPRPMAIYRIDEEFLLCYDEFAFYIDKTGRRSRKEFMMSWEGKPTSFALCGPYVLAFEPSFVEVRHIETGVQSQVIRGSNMRPLFADTVDGSDGGDILVASDDRILSFRTTAGQEALRPVTIASS